MNPSDNRSFDKESYIAQNGVKFLHKFILLCDCDHNLKTLNRQRQKSRGNKSFKLQVLSLNTAVSLKMCHTGINVIVGL